MTRRQGNGDDGRVPLLGIPEEAGEGRPGDHHLVARLENGLADVADHGVGARGHDELFDGYRMTCGERLRELERPSARIAIQVRRTQSQAQRARTGTAPRALR